MTARTTPITTAALALGSGLTLAALAWPHATAMAAGAASTTTSAHATETATSAAAASSTTQTAASDAAPIAGALLPTIVGAAVPDPGADTRLDERRITDRALPAVTAILDPVAIGPPMSPSATAGVCPQIVESHTDADFTGGSFIAQAGFVENEIAAVSYTIDPSDFPIRLVLGEAIFATSNAAVTTTTEWTFLVWEGTPATGSLVASFSSDGTILPHIVIPPGTNGVNVQVMVDPGDPEQIVIQNNGTATFSIGYRIDAHNQPSPSPCFIGPDPCCNAFPTTDVSGLQSASGNWLNGINCGPFGCPANGGWSTFAALPGLCTPSGDWVMRATWESFSCSGGGTGACCLPDDGGCFIVTEADCLSVGGTYLGDDVPCDGDPCADPPGACCLGTECEQLSEVDCTMMGGVWTAAGVPCDDSICNPEGACCIPTTGGCLTLTQADCDLVGGVFQGGGTACGDIICFPEGACCLPDGTCTDGISPEDCDALGGVFQGDGTDCGTTDCPEPVGACCLNGGTACLELSEADCAIVAGTWAGIGTTCDDGDGNGVADDCVSCTGDIDASGTVDFSDVLTILASWGPCPGCPADLDDSGSVDFSDLLTVLSAWGDC